MGCAFCIYKGLKHKFMKITIDTEVLKREHLTMGEFLVMLIGYYDVKYKDVLDKLIDKGIVKRSVFVRPYLKMIIVNVKKKCLLCMY